MDPSAAAKSDPAIRARVHQAMAERTARWCEIVRVELWKGVGGEKERDGLRALARSVPLLPMNDAVWEEACLIASRIRHAGSPDPTDILIFACARVHGACIEHVDKHFDLLENLPR